MTDDDIVIWYRPRIRLWRDLKGDWHLAGEPDGLASVVAAFRRVARRIEDLAEADLRTDPIPDGRNPVPERGIAKQFQNLAFEYTVSATPDETIVRLNEMGDRVIVSISKQNISLLGFALLETLDGEGDFSISVDVDSGRRARLWFWGYSNQHGTSTF
jgi:hypothetical protein